MRRLVLLVAGVACAQVVTACAMFEDTSPIDPPYTIPARTPDAASDTAKDPGSTSVYSDRVDAGPDAVAVATPVVTNVANGAACTAGSQCVSKFCSASGRCFDKVTVKQVEPIMVSCTSSGQACDTRFPVRVVTGGEGLSVGFVASPNHCSTLSVTFYVDGVAKYTSLFLDAAAATGTVVLVPPKADQSGSHLVEVAGTGALGGCNTGILASWAGTLTLSNSL